ncbi:G-type lectin S-receptor-like serine/threonine-protein kinase RKS1 [Morella rubra]|uniref:Receptor-like serine/threonine-protein kinase n=1 Tax=Morella rubra TaxID=262757 RepID=A0A6A1V1A2_9ROSI|nr:G-type lectin S-receptor-like serine/threonine-protein kinase RKS1 [Morella rubra]
MDTEKMLKCLMLVVLFFFPSCTSIDTLTANQSIKDGQSLMSKEKNFALGFFSPGNSSHRFLGIWFVKVREQTAVWIANRNDPINGSSGVLSINKYGNLILYDSYNRPVWSTDVSVQGTTSSVAHLLDSGNLVLVQESNNKLLWQSFDYPTDTLLPSMKLGLNRRTGLDRYLTSSKSQEDPGVGDYSYKLNPTGSPQFFLYNGSTPYYCSWPWPWRSLAATTPADYSINFVYNQDEISYFYILDDPTIITRVVLENSGSLRQFAWNDGDNQWKERYVEPKYRCDTYGLCGAYSKCNPDNVNKFECSCLPGYEPKSPRDWYLRNGSGGCVRKQLGLSMCGNGEGFAKVAQLKPPDASKAAWIDLSMSSTECEKACLRNCSCTAYIRRDIDGKRTGCLAYYGKLMGSLEYTNEGLDLYVRVDATELAKYKEKSNGFLDKNRKLVSVLLPVAVTMLLVSFLAYMWLRKKRKTKVKRKLPHQSFNVTTTKGSLDGDELKYSSRHPDLVVFDLSSMVAATENFSLGNKLGQGGFGSVFKGQLSNGQEIAVKRLSKCSLQGIEEFKNEVMLIAKLQHRNLVKVLGCCIQGEEKMLIYEYMQNRSLDFFIFDHTRRSSLNWVQRFEIILGIARGILYLHQDSRLRIIHRDLKTSNVLLDAEMNPKISDFGMARMFKGDQIQDRTTRVVGTYGYMSPEYAVFGRFSRKSDVFSFGVVVLEIITGKKNNVSYQDHPSLTLIGRVWELWKEDRALEIVDPSVKESYVSDEVLRCIHIALLCVEEDAGDRPTTMAVLLMLSSEATALPSPKQPAFIFGRPLNESDSVVGQPSYSVNQVTITSFQAR